ncbi:MAG: hypothetical protein GY953_58495, partial [bacterium]|nr:hypothetical protein [bacterium]
MAASEESYRFAGSEFERGRALLAQAYRYYEAGDYSSAIPHLEQSILLIPPLHRLHALALHFYGFALAHSDDPDGGDHAAEIVPELRKKFHGLRDAAVERTKLLWLGGLVLV